MFSTNRCTLVVINNELFGCGENQYGQLGFYDEKVSIFNFTKIDCDFDNSGIKIIKCGYRFNLVLTNAGNLFGCGSNLGCTLGIPVTKNTAKITTFSQIPIYGVAQIDCCGEYSIVLTQSNELYFFGKCNELNELNDGFTYVSGSNGLIKVEIGTNSMIKKISCNTKYIFVLTDNELIKCKKCKSDNEYSKITLDNIGPIVDLKCNEHHILLLSECSMFICNVQDNHMNFVIAHEDITKPKIYVSENKYFILGENECEQKIKVVSNDNSEHKITEYYLKCDSDIIDLVVSDQAIFFISLDIIYYMGINFMGDLGIGNKFGDNNRIYEHEFLSNKNIALSYFPTRNNIKRAI